MVHLLHRLYGADAPGRCLIGLLKNSSNRLYNQHLTLTLTHAYLVCVGPDWHGKCPCQTEVRELNVSFRVDEQILRLEITMQDAVTVTE